MEKVKAKFLKFNRWLIVSITIVIIFLASLVVIPVLFPPTPPTGTSGTLLPSADTTVKQLNPSSGTTHYLLMNDSLDSTYVNAYFGVVGSYEDQYNCTRTLLTGTINNVTVYARTKKVVVYGTAQTNTAVWGIVRGGSRKTTSTTLTTTITTYNTTYANDPWTTVAWTWANLNNTDFTMALYDSTNGETYETYGVAYETYLVVDYAVSAPTAPTITLNTAGNPNEDSFGTDTTNRMYRNGTLNYENWMYVNATITDDNGVNYTCFEWKNSSVWQNHTMTHQTGTDFYYINMTDQPQYQSYTFNIYANDTMNNWTKYVWKYYDYESVWGTEEAWRKYVGLNYQTSMNLTYSLVQFFSYSYNWDQTEDRVFPHEQPTDGTVNDTGILKRQFQTENYTIWCGGYIGYFFDENVAINENFILKDIYLHVWWSTTNPSSNTPFDVCKFQDSYVNLLHHFPYSTINFSSDTSVAEYNFTFGYHDIYYLAVRYWNITDITFTDNDIDLLSFLLYGTDQFPSIVSSSTPYLLSFMIFNLPSNATLQTMDSDGDGISDYDELYVNYTCPFSGITSTILSVGWNNFTAWDVDVDKTLGQVNASLNLDNINWAVITVDYGNGTQWSLVYGTNYNSEKLIVSTSDKLYIYCNVAGTWGHTYP